MAVTPVHAVLTVTAAGTRQAVVSDADIRPSSVYFEALHTNTGYILIGLVTVTSVIYIARLAAGQGFELRSDGIGAGGHLAVSGLQLSNIYVDSTVSGEKVQMTYMYPIGG